MKEQVFSLKKNNEELDQEEYVLRLKLQVELEEHQKLETKIQNLEEKLQTLEGSLGKGIPYEDVSPKYKPKDDKIVSMQYGQVRMGTRILGKGEKETQRYLSKSHVEQEVIILQYQDVLNLYQTSENRAMKFQVRLALAQEENSKIKYKLSSGALNLKVIEEKSYHLERDKNALEQEREHLIK